MRVYVSEYCRSPRSHGFLGVYATPCQLREGNENSKETFSVSYYFHAICDYCLKTRRWVWVDQFCPGEE